MPDLKTKQRLQLLAIGLLASAPFTLLAGFSLWTWALDAMFERPVEGQTRQEVVARLGEPAKVVRRETEHGAIESLYYQVSVNHWVVIGVDENGVVVRVREMKR